MELLTTTLNEHGLPGHLGPALADYLDTLDRPTAVARRRAWTRLVEAHAAHQAVLGGLTTADLPAAGGEAREALRARIASARRGYAALARAAAPPRRGPPPGPRPPAPPPPACRGGSGAAGPAVTRWPRCTWARRCRTRSTRPDGATSATRRRCDHGGMAYRELPPPPGLAAIVRCLWVREAGAGEEVLVLPDGCV